MLKSPPVGAFTCPVFWAIVGVSSHIIGDRVLYNWTCKPSEVIARNGTIEYTLALAWRKLLCIEEFQCSGLVVIVDVFQLSQP